MKKEIISLLVCLAMISTLLIGCGEKEVPAEEPTTETTDMSSEEEITSEAEEVTEKVSGYVYGTWEGNVYTNSQLGFTMTFPDSYTILTDNSSEKTIEQITDSTSENSDITTANTSNPVHDFMAIAPDESIRVSFGAEKNLTNLTFEEYKDILLGTFDSFGIDYALASDPYLTKLGNLDFYSINLIVDYSKLSGIEDYIVGQSFLIYIDEDYVYSFILMFLTPDDKTRNETKAILDSIKAIN